jgi:hypothetical protein
MPRLRHADCAALPPSQPADRQLFTPLSPPRQHCRRQILAAIFISPIFISLPPPFSPHFLHYAAMRLLDILRLIFHLQPSVFRFSIIDIIDTPPLRAIL